MNYKRSSQEKILNLQIKSENEKFTKIQNLSNTQGKHYFENEKIFFKKKLSQILIKITITLRNGKIKDFGECILKKNIFYNLDNKGKFFVLNFRDKFYLNKKIYFSLFNFKKQNNNKKILYEENKKKVEKPIISNKFINNRDMSNTEIINNNINLKIYNDNRNLEKYKNKNSNEKEKKFHNCHDLFEQNKELLGKKKFMENIIKNIVEIKTKRIFIFDLPIIILQKKIIKKFDFDFRFLKEKIICNQKKQSEKLKKIKNTQLENNYLFLKKKKNYFFLNEKSNINEINKNTEFNNLVKETIRLRKRIKHLLKDNIEKSKNNLKNHKNINKEQKIKNIKKFEENKIIKVFEKVKDKNFDENNKNFNKKKIFQFFSFNTKKIYKKK